MNIKEIAAVKIMHFAEVQCRNSLHGKMNEWERMFETTFYLLKAENVVKICIC